MHSCSFSRHTLLTPALLCEMDTEYFPETGAYFPTSERLEEPWGLLSHHYLTQTQTQRHMQAGLIFNWHQMKVSMKQKSNLNKHNHDLVSINMQSMNHSSDSKFLFVQSS